jgi:type IV pilus assembly protein PilV
MKAPSMPKAQRGVALIEVLVSMVIIAFGVLGFVGLQAKTTVLQIEAYQRSQAWILLEDLTQRMRLNQSNIAAYVATDIGTTDPGNCSTLAMGATRDICEWSELIRGSAEKSGTSAVGAMLGARGCVNSPGANFYQISIAWQGQQATGAPANVCGKDAYSAENMRRVVSSVIRVGVL